MKKIIFFLILGSTIFSTDLFAQPTWKMSPNYTTAMEGEEVCIPIKFRDFTHLFEVSFSLGWDPAVLEFSKIQTLHPDLVANYGLSMADFDTSPALVDNGQLTFHWDYGQGDCQTIGATLADEETFFEVCFIVVGIYGDCSPVDITDFPVDRFVTRNNTGCTDIGEFVQNSFVCTDVRPVKLIAGSTNGDNGETACVPIRVEDFTNIIAMQFSINWDPNLLEFQNATTLNLPGFQVNPHVNTTDAANGVITVSWFDPTEARSVADGAEILSLCFEILGDCGDVAAIEITEDPTPFEAINATSINIGNGKEIGIFPCNGEIIANCFTPGGAEINIPDATVNPGQDFCLDVTAGANMNDIAIIQFSLTWNPSILDFDMVTNVFEDNQCQPSPFNNPIDESSISQGILIVQYENNFPGCDLNPGDLLFTICFKAIGPGGSTSSVAVVNEPSPILIDKTGGQVVDIGLNADNGLVQINQIQGLTVLAGNGSITEDPGQETCIDFTVQDFNEMTRMDFSVEWETSVLSYNEITNLNPDLPDFLMLNFTTTTVANGALGVEWADFAGNGISLDDGEVLFTICFDVIGDPGECSDITFTALPIPINIENINSNNTNVGLNGQPGEVCVGDPFSFIVDIGNGSGTLNSISCVDFAVQNFDQLTNMEFSINWDFTELEYDHLEITGGLADFFPTSYDDDILLTEDGILTIDWETTNGILGTSVPDGTVIFQVCYKILAFPPNCSNLFITDSPQNMVITSAITGPSNIGLKFTEGEICSTSGPMPDATISMEDCPGDGTGGIDLTISGGSGSYIFTWEGPNNDTYSTEDITGVPAGDYAVTICDAPNPNLCVEEVYTIPVNPNAPVADAGPDDSFECGTFSTVLDGSGSSTGPNITYLWEITCGGGLILPGEETLQNPQVVGVSCYQLTVTDTDTGCSVTDEVSWDQPIIPGVTIQKDEPFIIKCDPDTLTIDGSESTIGADFMTEWITQDGGTMVDPGTTSLTPQILSAGTYILQITNVESNCVETDTAFVIEDKVLPIVEAGLPDTLGCEDTSLPLLGAGSDVGANFTYEWSAIVDGEVCGPIDAIDAAACAAGTYQLLVTNTDNGCVATDIVEMEEDLEKPQVDAGLSKELNCVDLELILDGSGSVGPEFIYAWTANPGNIVSGDDTLTPTVDQPGTYTLRIRDTSNDCESESEVIVTHDDTPPVAVVVSDFILLNCETTFDSLDATGSSIDANIAVEWLDDDNMPVSNDYKYHVTESGLYTLVVENTENGCTASQFVLVEQDTMSPIVDAGPDKTIDCVNKTALLEGVVESNPNLQVQWQGPNANCFVTSANNPFVEVSCPGTYTLLVLNTESGCQNSSTVEVVEDVEAPTYETLVHGDITCDEPCVDLAIENIVAGTDFSVEWENSNTPGDVLGVTEVFSVCDDDTYIVIVTNLDNGCTTDELVAAVENTTVPNAVATNSGDVTCLLGTSTIDASGSDQIGTSFTWSTTPPGQIPGGMQNEVSLDVISGTYTVTVEIDSTGCTATAFTIVGENTTPPNVDAGQDMPKDCGVEVVTLTGNGSVGSDYTYQWFFGGNPIPGANALTVDVTEVGDYTLVILNTNNGCTAEDMASVFSTTDGPPADASFDVEPCSDMAFLMGNLPDGATGVWTIVSGSGQIEDPTSPETWVNNLSVGVTQITWTLSLAGCEDYSSALIEVPVDAFQPDGIPDQIMVGNEDPRTITFDALANDITNGALVTFEIVDLPDVGTIDNVTDGVITFTAPTGFFGEIDFTYTICSVECPDQCDTTFVRIEFEQPDEIDCSLLPNGITPNNDGMNDEFFTSPGIDFLYPNNNLIIFNRWGDVVYEASPYVNNWKGTNQSGDDLPTGTYYYILRLNVGESEICKGDITIMK